MKNLWNSDILNLKWGDTVEKAYKFRIYPTKEQERMFQKNFGCVRYVYNHYLEMRINKYKEDKSNMRYSQCSADLTQLKKIFGVAKRCR